MAVLWCMIQEWRMQWQPMTTSVNISLQAPRSVTSVTRLHNTKSIINSSLMVVKTMVYQWEVQVKSNRPGKSEASWKTNLKFRPECNKLSRHFYSFGILGFKYGQKGQGQMQLTSKPSYTILKFVPNWCRVVEGVVVERNDDFTEKVIPSESVIVQNRNAQGSSLKFWLCHVILGQKIRSQIQMNNSCIINCVQIYTKEAKRQPLVYGVLAISLFLV